MRKSPFVTRSGSIEMSSPADQIAFCGCGLGRDAVGRCPCSVPPQCPSSATRELSGRACVCPHVKSLEPLFTRSVPGIVNALATQTQAGQ